MITLQTTPREPGGKLANARAKGLIPAVYYGGNSTPVSIFMDRVEFQKAYKQAGTSSIISLKTEGGVVRALVHEVGVDPIRGVPMHVDFRVVDMSHTTHISIPLEFVGEAPGVKTLGASVVKVLHDIEVEAMADKLPHSIQVDISSLVNEDSHITIGDLVLPTGVSVYHAKTDDIVASLSIQKEESEDSKTESEA